MRFSSGMHAVGLLFENQCIWLNPKNLNNVETETNVLNPIKSIYDKSTADVILINERPGTRQRCLLVSSVQHATGGANHWIRQEKERKSIQIGNKDVKPSLFRGDINIFAENVL